jgi:hypothetical protein
LIQFNLTFSPKTFIHPQTHFKINNPTFLLTVWRPIYSFNFTRWLILKFQKWHNFPLLSKKEHCKALIPKKSFFDCVFTKDKHRERSFLLLFVLFPLLLITLKQKWVILFIMQNRIVEWCQFFGIWSTLWIFAKVAWTTKYFGVTNFVMNFGVLRS